LIVSLVASKFCLVLVPWLTLIIIMLLIVTLLLVELNENKIDKCQLIVLDLSNCTSICSPNNPDTIIYHSFFSFTSTHMFKILDCSSFTISLFAFPIHIGYNFESLSLTWTKFSKAQVLKWSVCTLLPKWGAIY